MKMFSRKYSDNTIIKGSKTPNSCKENHFRYPEILKRKDSKPLQLQTNQTEVRSELRSPSAMSAMTQSPLNSNSQFIIQESIPLTHRSQSMFQDAQYIDYIITNKEVSGFLKKHFLHEHFNTNQTKHTKLICDSWDKVPIAYFIKALFQEYPEIIEDHQLTDKLMMKLRQLIKDLVSEDGQLLSLNKLQIHTRQLGLLGLLLTVLRDIQNISQNTNISDEFKKVSQELISNVEQEINEKFKKIIQKQQNIEKFLTKVIAKVHDSSDLFRHEVQTKTTIYNLQQQIKQKDQTILELETKIKTLQSQQSVYSSIEESQNRMAPKVSPIRVASPTNSPFNDNQQINQRFLHSIMHQWDMNSNCEEYRFSQILLAPDKSQVSFKHFQLIPIIRQMPGLNDFIQKSQFTGHIITNWIQNLINNNNNIVLELYDQILSILPSIKLSDSEQYIYEIMLLFLKLSAIILQVKTQFKINNLKEWIQQRRQIGEQQNQFLRNIVNQLIEINQFSVKEIPKNKNWNQLYSIQEYSECSKLIQHPVVSHGIKKQLIMICSKQNINRNVSIVCKLLYSLYSNNPEDCISLMGQIQGEQDQDQFICRWLQESDIRNHKNQVQALPKNTR